MNTAKKKIYSTLALVGLIIVLLVLVAIATEWRLNSKRVHADTSQIDHINEQVVEQIQQYQNAGEVQVSIVGAPRDVVGDIAKSSGDTSVRAVLARQGYSLVSVAGELQKRRMESTGSYDSSPEPASSDTDWLNFSFGVAALIRQAEDAGRDWTFGWIRLNQPVAMEVMEKALQEFGASVLGSTGNVVRAKLPKNRASLESIDALSWVTGLAALPPRLKLRGDIEKLALEASPSSLNPVFVTVVSSVMDEEFRREFKNLGLVVGPFDPTIRTYPLAATGAQILQLAQLDFVQSIEPIAIVTASHDTAVPAMGVDSLREVGATSGSFTGIHGISVPIAVMDTGLNTSHVAISSLRKSICGANFIKGEDHDIWVDKHGHGTHVTGTVAGNGYLQPHYTGMAPGIEHIRFAKVLNSSGYASTFSIVQGMDFLAKSTACPEEGWSEDRVKPLIVNMSLSRRNLEFDGKSTGPRKLDSIVWTHRQLYVVANSNSSIYGYSNYGSAKNSLAVGAVYDNGDLVGFSSEGPTIDGRLLPSIVGTGTHVISAEGNASYDGYRSSSGTSMSSPSVAGVAALLMDASAYHREQPALTRARLMASAVKPDAWLMSERAFPQNNTNGPGSVQAKYGMGLVSARTSIANSDVLEGWTSSSASVTLENGEYAYQDIEVPESASRLDLVMTWDEPPADTIASTVLNDLDLWVDFGADCGSGTCGEYSSRSRIDNVEWVIILDPQPGTYRVKIAGERIYTESPRAAVAWTVIRGNSTPQLTLDVEQDIYEKGSGAMHNHNVEVVVSTNGYVASGTELHVDCRTQDNEPCESFGFVEPDAHHLRRSFRGLVQREDGLGITNQYVDRLYLGEVAHDEEQRVLVQLASESEGPLTIHLTATSWNAKGASNSVIFRESGSDAEPDPETQPPINDSYENPRTLEDQEGSIEIDTMLATSEPGEPIGRLAAQRPARSIWFSWVAERSGMASFVASPREATPRWYLEKFNPSVDVFQIVEDCCGIASAKPIASSNWSAQFFAQIDTEYRIRIGSAPASLPLILSWLVGERPPNDYFAEAITLTGSSGTVSGHNLGATIEPGEGYGTLASSIWYRWTAPEDGTWEFQIEDAQLIHLLVFSGETIDNLRLVSGITSPGEPVSVATVQDETYHVMVASPDAISGGWKFNDLTWSQKTEERAGWDWFDFGTQLRNSESGYTFVEHSIELGVEPSEHKSTGVQSGWMKWIAPSSGLYTWYWEHPGIHFAAFSGSAVDALTAHNEVGVASGSEFVFEAVEGEEYSISAGRRVDSNEAYDYSSSYIGRGLWWGKTPENNSLGGAIVLTGAEGSVAGSNRLATTGSMIRAHLGYSSLWYAYEATQSGWYRFWIEAENATSMLSAFHPPEANLQPQFIMASRPSTLLDDKIEVIVYVEEDASVLLRIGSATPRSGSEFELHWAPTEPPQWLVYRGRIADGWRDDSGQIVSLVEPTDMAFNSDSTLLFVSTRNGLSTFQRNGTTGQLSLLQQFKEPEESSNVVWDPYRDRLYVNNGDNWWTYNAKPQEPMLLEFASSDYDIGTNAVTKSRGSPILFMGKNGDYLYRTTDHWQSVYTFDSNGSREFLGRNSVVSHSVYPSHQGSHWWGWNFYDMLLLERELGSGFYHQVSTLSEDDWRNITGSFSNDDAYFFAVGRSVHPTAEIEAYGIDYSTGEFELSAHAALHDLRLSRCSFAIPRTGSHTVDVLCDAGGFVVEFTPDTGEISMIDYVAKVTSRTTPDRFGRTLPSYLLSGPNPIEASPDGKHVYVSTQRRGILIFERFGNEVRDVEESPIFGLPRLDLLQASKNQIQFGDDVASDGCLTATNWEIDGVSYAVESSKWQQRTVNAPWSDIEGTEKSQELCSHASNESKEFRMVATFTVDGVKSEFASNFFGQIIYERLDSLTVAPGEIELDVLSITSCTTISNLGIDGVTYTVKESKWQVRDDPDSDWSDIDATKTTGELCPYDPDDNREYRLVGRFIIDDEEGYYSSNVMQEESEQI